MSAVGIVTVLHDSAPDLQRLLRSLEPVSPRPQLVVVDAGSQDDGPEIARAFGAEVIEAGDVGFGAANNLGVARVTGSVTLLLNPDVTVLDAPVVERLARHARREDALHVPRLLNPDGSVQRSAHPLPGRAAALLPALLPPRALPAPAARPRRAVARRRRRAARRLGDRRSGRGAHRHAAPDRPLRRRAVPVLRGSRPLPARPRRPASRRSCTPISRSSTAAATAPSPPTAASRTSCWPRAAARSCAPTSAAARSRSTTPPRRSPSPPAPRARTALRRDAARERAQLRALISARRH